MTVFTYFKEIWFLNFLGYFKNLSIEFKKSDNLQFST